MSEIFLATQKGLAGFRKIVVLKSILPDISGEEEFVRMFLEEARTTAAFNHPNIAQVFDLDTDDGTLFLAMEFVQGATLVEMARACRQAKEAIPIGFTLASVRDTALALHYAHNFTDPRGRKQVVIHRDVAEKNIMVSFEGTTKLLDFGIAKALGRRGEGLTSIGMVKGTSGYMSPEQIRGEPLDPRSDIFALGVVLHECLTGMRLFHGKNPEDGMLAALREDVAAPSKQSPTVSAALDQVTLKALARDREQRFSTALEFARAIERACPGQLWHPEQSGDLVQRFYSERRLQTRELIEQAQGGAELTGELKIDRLMAQVSHRNLPSVEPTPPRGAKVASAAPPSLPTPPRPMKAPGTGLQSPATPSRAVRPVAETPLTRSTRGSNPAVDNPAAPRVRASSTHLPTIPAPKAAAVVPEPPVSAPPLRRDPRAASSRANTSENLSMPTDPVGIDVRITRAPVQHTAPAGKDVTQIESHPPDARPPPSANDFDDDDDSAKTIPATSLPPELIQRLRDDRARADAFTAAAQARAEAMTAAQAHAVPRPAAQQPQTPLPPPVPPPTPPRTTSGETTSTDAIAHHKPAPKFDPFSDIVDSAEQGMRTAIGRPFDTHSDEEEDNAHETFDSGPDSRDRNTDTGVENQPKSRGIFIVLGGVVALAALAGGLYALKLPPFAPRAATAAAAKLKVPTVVAPAQPAPPTVVAPPAPAVAPQPAAAKAPSPEPVAAAPARMPVAAPTEAPANPEPTAKAEPAPAPHPAEATHKSEPARPAEPARKPEPAVSKSEQRRRQQQQQQQQTRRNNAAKAAPTEQATVVLGSLSLVVEPPMHVFSAGKDLGMTPLKAVLGVGRQTLKLVPASGPSKTVMVDIKESGVAARFDFDDL